MLHISIKPDVIFHFLGFPITNTWLTSGLVVIFCLLLGVWFSANSGSRSTPAFVVRMAIGKIHRLFQEILGERTSEFFPLLASLFFFILFSNWLGLLPGVGSITLAVDHEHTVPLLKGSTADLNTTLALAMMIFVVIQVAGVRHLGLRDYSGKFISTRGPIDFFAGILELISEFSKIISFAFRLFGNVFAGEVLILVMVFLVPVLASFPFLMLEIFVGFIQAMVFAMLSAVFLQLATSKHHA